MRMMYGTIELRRDGDGERTDRRGGIETEEGNNEWRKESDDKPKMKLRSSQCAHLQRVCSKKGQNQEEKNEGKKIGEKKERTTILTHLHLHRHPSQSPHPTLAPTTRRPLPHLPQLTEPCAPTRRAKPGGTGSVRTTSTAQSSIVVTKFAVP